MTYGYSLPDSLRNIPPPQGRPPLTHVDEFKGSVKMSVDLPKFRDPTLLQMALTLRSYVNEHPTAQHNERLEFLGDAILNFLSGEFLYQRFPTVPEGELTALRSQLTDAQQFAQFAVQLKLGPLLRLGRGAEREGGRQNPKLLSGTFEALIGAYFLDSDSNIAPVRIYVTPLLEAALATVEVTNYKSQFQAWALATVGTIPDYVIVQATGPDHAREFVAEVRVAGRAYGRGIGRKKQMAEKEAARQALVALNLIP